MTDQKTIARHLDIAADRCELVDRDPATRKQIWYLASLIAKDNGSAEDVNCALTRTQAMLTKRQASVWIDDYLKQAA